MSNIINQSPILTEHLGKVLKLEAELMLNKEYTSDMIIDCHIQLLALAIVAAGEYNSAVCENIFHVVGHKLVDVIQDELKNGPPSIATIQQAAEENPEVKQVLEKSSENLKSILVFPKTNYEVN